jgi:uncharacterized protein involved in exopolysaccharide biosynthesis
MSPQREPLVQPVAHIGANWKIVAGACATAILVSLIATLLLPKKFTAVTRIFIEPPAGSDPRTATTVSPIYFDSLRTYELFASGDTLFLQAVEKFHLRKNGAAVDRLKKSILRVEVLRNTRILDISTTLTDPQLAHELSLYLAQETVKMNENTSQQGDREFAAEAEKQYAAARSRMDAAQRAWDATPDQVSAEGLRSEVSDDEALREGLRKELTELEVDDPDASGAGASKIAAYRHRLTALSEQIATKRKNLAAMTAHLESLESDLGAARRTFAAGETRLQDLRSAAGYRGERLRIIDPGIVPEHPSSPDLMLNLLVALIAGAVLSVGGLLLTAAGSQDEAPRRRPVSIVAK